MPLLKQILRILIPWLGFSLAASYLPDRWIDPLWAVFLVGQITFSRHQLKAGNPMSWTASVVLTTLFVNGYVHLIPWVNDHATTLCFLAFATTALLSVVLGAPFTLHYARASVPEQFWIHPGFIRVNRHMSVFWGLTYALDTLTMIYWGSAAPILSQVVCMTLIAGAFLFSQFYPAQMRKRAAAAAAAAQ